MSAVRVRVVSAVPEPPRSGERLMDWTEIRHAAWRAYARESDREPTDEELEAIEREAS